MAVELRLKTGGVWGCLGDSGYPLEATYVDRSGGESGPGHFILHYMGVCVKYPVPNAHSWFFCLFWGFFKSQPGKILERKENSMVTQHRPRDWTLH